MNSEQTQKLAEKIYEGLTEEDIVEIEKAMLDRSNFFEQDRIFKLLEGVTDETLSEAVEMIKKSGKEN